MHLSYLQVSSDNIEVYFQNLSEALERLTETNIFNYDETNVTEDPSRKECIVQRGLVEKEAARYPLPRIIELIILRCCQDVFPFQNHVDHQLYNYCNSA